MEPYGSAQVKDAAGSSEAKGLVGATKVIQCLRKAEY